MVTGHEDLEHAEAPPAPAGALDLLLLRLASLWPGAVGLVVFTRVDHAAGAAEVGKTLRPTELPVIGDPQGGTPTIRRS